MAISNGKKTLLHIAKAQLGLEEDDYRALLARIAGVASSRELTDAGFTRVVEEMERLGFRSSADKANFGRDRRWDMATGRQVAFIRGLWRDFTAGQGTDASLDKWLRNRFGIGALRMLDRQKAHKVIAALRSMNERKRAGAEAGDAGADAGGDDAA